MKVVKATIPEMKVAITEMKVTTRVVGDNKLY
jgi:hypothetical protein